MQKEAKIIEGKEQEKGERLSVVMQQPRKDYGASSGWQKIDSTE